MGFSDTGTKYTWIILFALTAIKSYVIKVNEKQIVEIYKYLRTEMWNCFSFSTIIAVIATINSTNSVLTQQKAI